MLKYRPPVQERAMETERRFLVSVKRLFAKNGVARTTIDDIAADAGLHRGAFLKRFGSKDGAKLLIFEEYCIEAEHLMRELRELLCLGHFAVIEDAFYCVSSKLERVQRQHFAANRAMYEDYANGLEIHEKTNRMFMGLVELINAIDDHFNPGVARHKSCYFASAQLLVTLNFEYVLSAMPGLPQSAELRHKMISTASLLPLSENWQTIERKVVADSDSPLAYSVEKSPHACAK